MGNALKSLKSAAKLMKTAFGDNYFPDKNEINKLKGQLASALEQVKKDPKLIADLIRTTKTGDDAFALAGDFLEDGSIDISSKESFKEEYERKHRTLDEKVGMIESILHNGAEGHVDQNQLADAVDMLMDEIGDEDGDLEDPENRAIAQLDKISSMVGKGSERYEKSFGKFKKGDTGLSVTASDEAGTASSSYVSSNPIGFKPSWETSTTTYSTSSSVTSNYRIKPMTFTSSSKSPKYEFPPEGDLVIEDEYMMKRMIKLIGQQCSPMQIEMALAAIVKHFDIKSFGSIHVTCSDETETASRTSFSRGSLSHLLPMLPGRNRSPLTTCNLGGCYETGSLGVAASHFGTAAPSGLFIKVQSHCGIETQTLGQTYGSISRYGHSSHACGALDAVSTGNVSCESFQRLQTQIGQDTISQLSRIDPTTKPLFAAVTQARTQADRATDECLSEKAGTIFFVYGCININGLTSPSEVPVILRIIDLRKGTAKMWECGLPSQLSRLEIHEERNKFSFKLLSSSKKLPDPTPKDS